MPYEQYELGSGSSAFRVQRYVSKMTRSKNFTKDFLKTASVHVYATLIIISRNEISDDAGRWHSFNYVNNNENCVLIFMRVLLFLKLVKIVLK